MKSRELWVAFAVLIVVLFLAKPATWWEFDEPLFAQALHHYDPVAHHPPPPGYPVFIFVAQLVRGIIPSDFGALVTLSFVASAIAFVILALAFSRLTDPTTGLLGAVIFYFSPAMLVHSTLPISEPGALLLLATALYFMPSSPVLFAVFASLAIGWRPQFSIFIVPLVLCRAAALRGQAAGGGGPTLKVLSAFTLTCLTWFIPLTLRLGGFEKLLRFERGQAQYLAAHDAGASRRGWNALTIAVRFIADSWGPIAMSLPVLAFAAVGFMALRRIRTVWPLLGAALVYIVFALAIMDPADGVRYAIPFTLVVSLAVAAGLKTQRGGLVAAFAAGSIIYTSSLLVQRSTKSSPEMEAASRIPREAVVLYELPLWPQSTYLFAHQRIERVDDGLRKYVDSPQTPLVLYAEGESDPPGALNFRWAPSQAYATLTRDHYRVASVTPFPPERRFKPIRGVHSPEREAEGDEWRWLDADAEMQLPAPGATSISLRLGLPITAASDNVVTIYANGTPQRRVQVSRGSTRDVVITSAVPVTNLRFVSARSFTAIRDPRSLAVRLHDLSMHLAPAASRRERPAA